MIMGRHLMKVREWLAASKANLWPRICQSNALSGLQKNNRGSFFGSKSNTRLVAKVIVGACLVAKVIVSACLVTKIIVGASLVAKVIVGARLVAKVFMGACLVAKVIVGACLVEKTIVGARLVAKVSAPWSQSDRGCPLPLLFAFELLPGRALFRISFLIKRSFRDPRLGRAFLIICFFINTDFWALAGRSVFNNQFLLNKNFLYE